MISTVEVLDRMPNLNDTLTAEQRSKILHSIQILTYKKNEKVYCEGERVHDLMFVISGKLKIYKDGVGGKTQIIRVAMPDSYLGYRPYFANQNYQTTAVAMETAVIAQIPMKLLNEMMHENAYLACFFVNELAQHLGTAHERAVNLTQKHIRGRLAEALLYLRDAYGLEEDGSTLSIYLSREDMANMSNMTTSNAIRTLSSFAQEHLIAIDGKKIKLMDEEGLVRVSKFG